MPKVRIRAARTSDRAHVEAVCVHSWEEADDYVPQVWDEWLADPRGKLLVAELDGRVVSLAHHLATGAVRGIDADGRLAVLALICETNRQDAVDLGYVDGRAEAMEALLLAIRAVAARRGCDRVRLRAVDEPQLIDVLRRAGYDPGWDRDLWIFELSDPDQAPTSDPGARHGRQTCDDTSPGRAAGQAQRLTIRCQQMAPTSQKGDDYGRTDRRDTRGDDEFRDLAGGRARR